MTKGGDALFTTLKAGEESLSFPFLSYSFHPLFPNYLSCSPNHERTTALKVKLIYGEAVLFFFLFI